MVSRYNSIPHVNPRGIELFSSVIRYQSRHILPYSYKIQLNQDIKYHMNTIANINPDMALSVFSVICSGTQGLQEYHSQYQSGYGFVCILRYLCFKIQLKEELKFYKNTIANINVDMAQSVFSGVCVSKYNLCLL